MRRTFQGPLQPASQPHPPCTRKLRAQASTAPGSGATAAGDALQASISFLRSARDRFEPKRAPPCLSVSVEDLAAELSEMNLILGERLGKGRCAESKLAISERNRQRASHAPRGSPDDALVPSSRATVYGATGGARQLTSSSAWQAQPGMTVAVKALVGAVPQEALTGAPARFWLHVCAHAPTTELATESELWSSLEHPRITRVLHASLSPAPLLIMEACEGGTLFAALRRGEPLDVRSIGLDVARALVATHEAGQAHRDVKSANVLLTRASGRLTAKLCDWGSAARLENSLPARPRPQHWSAPLLQLAGGSVPAPQLWVPVGTLLWMSPEMLQPHFEGERAPPGASGATADCFSFAVLLWELLERRLPWVEASQVRRAEVIRVVVKEGKRLPIAPWVHPEVAQLMRQCWAADARKRPTMRQVLERLEALESWGLPPKPVAPAARSAVSPGAAAAKPRSEEEELKLTLSEVEDEEPDKTAPGGGGETLSAPLSAVLAGALAGAESSTTTELLSSELLSALLPFAYEHAVGAELKAELDALVLRLKEAEARVLNLESRRKFDPLAALVLEGKASELLELQAAVRHMRSTAAVKAWAYIAELCAAANQRAQRELAAGRRLQEEAELATASKKRSPH